MSVSKARDLYKNYPDLFSLMFEHSFKDDPEHPDDIGVIYSKLSANAHGKAEPYWTPDMDMKPVYEDILKNDPESEAVEA